jgi:hypothetical protein
MSTPAVKNNSFPLYFLNLLSLAFLLLPDVSYKTQNTAFTLLPRNWKAETRGIARLMPNTNACELTFYLDLF